MKEERVKKMNQIYNYCMICNKRNGSWYYDCHPSSFGAKRHGSGKIVRVRECKSWKHNRKTQWKQQWFFGVTDSTKRYGRYSKGSNPLGTTN